MPLTPEEKAANARARRAGVSKQKEMYKAFESLDADGNRYKSEVLSYRELLNLFFGIRPEVENETDTEKKKYRKKNIVCPCGEELLGVKLEDEIPSFHSWLALRDKARKNLFWLGREVLKKGLIPTTHQIVCDQFIAKNFDGVFKKGYTIDDVHAAINRQIRQDEHGNDTKDMLLLDPRGFYKSTIDGIDCVQWLLNVPDIRILILTGEFKLAVAFMREIKNYFFLADGAEPREFHFLFPEYILTGVDGTSKEPLDCPARIHGQKESSLWVNSIDSNLSGWHCDIRKMDDIVTNRNCNTLETRQALKEKADSTTDLLDEWGFTDMIGTRYWADDYYGTRMKPDDEDGYTVEIKYFCRQCWVVKPEFAEVKLRQLQEHMVILAFPEKATWKSLQKKLRLNERSFRNQQLNEPSEPGEDSSFKITFLEDVLRAHTYQASAVPPGETFVCWDWAASSNRYSDWSVGIAGRVYRINKVDPLTQVNEFYHGLSILEVNFGRWKPSELAYQIVSFDKKWHPKQTLIEKSVGAELLQLEVQRNAMKYGVSLNIYWKPVNSQKDAKRNRIKSLETLLGMGRLWFVSGNWIDETYKQFTDYTGDPKNRGRKDDIPDAVSFFTFFLPTTEFSEDRKKIQDEQIKTEIARQQYNRIFGSEPTFYPEPVAPTESRPTDSRNRFFGGNGLHV